MSNELMDKLRRQAQKLQRRAAFPESENELILQAVGLVKEDKLGVPVLIGNPLKIHSAAKKAGALIEGVEIFDNTDKGQIEQLIERYSKRFDNFSETELTEKIGNSISCAMILCKLGEVDCVAAGREFTTAEIIRPALTILGLKQGVKRISSLGVLDIPGFVGPEGSLLALADCAVNPEPNAESLADIAISSAATVRQLLGWEPRVAMLAFSTCGSAQHESIDVVLEAIKLAKEREPHLKIDGEFQLDAAILPDVAKDKVKRGSEVAGCANVLVVPNLHAGNIAVKMVQIFNRANAYGPIVQGLTRPICDFSRSSPLSEMMGNITMMMVRS